MADLAHLTPELVVDFARQPERARRRCQEPDGGPPVTPAAAARQLVTDALGLVLDAPHGEFGSDSRNDALLREALQLKGRGYPNLFAYLGNAGAGRVKELAMNGLGNYFKLEDPTKVSSLCRGVEVTVQVPVGGGESMALLVPCIDRVDVLLDGDARVLTLVDYGVGGCDEGDEEQLLRLKVQAWALRECGAFECDSVAVRRLDLAGGGPGVAHTLSDEDLAHAGQLAVAAAQQYLEAVFPARPTAPWSVSEPKRAEAPRPAARSEEQGQKQDAGAPAEPRKAEASKPKARPEKQKKEKELSGSPDVEALATPKKAKAKAKGKAKQKKKKEPKAGRKSQDKQKTEAKGEIKEPAETVLSGAEGEEEHAEQQQQSKPKKAKASKATVRRKKPKKESEPESQS